MKVQSLLIASLLLVGCGGGASQSQPQNAVLQQGKWELALSDGTTFVEANLLIDQSGNVSASNSYVISTAVGSGSLSAYSLGECGVVFSGSTSRSQFIGSLAQETQQQLAAIQGTVTGTQSMTGTISFDGSTSISSICPFGPFISGGKFNFTATLVPPLNVTWSGTLASTNSSVPGETATIQLSEGANYLVTGSTPSVGSSGIPVTFHIGGIVVGAFLNTGCQPSPASGTLVSCMIRFHYNPDLKGPVPISISVGDTSFPSSGYAYYGMFQ
jgi:hypothetical protein